MSKLFRLLAFTMISFSGSVGADCPRWLTRAAGAVTRAAGSLRDRVAPPGWQPSAEFIARAKLAGAEELTRGTFATPVDLEIQLPQDRHSANTSESAAVDAAEITRLRAWIEDQTTLEGIPKGQYVGTEQYLAAVYGPELAKLRQHHLTVLWPRHGSVLYGTFRVTGRLGDVSAYFEHAPMALIDRPLDVVFARGAQAPIANEFSPEPSDQ